MADAPEMERSRRWKDLCVYKRYGRARGAKGLFSISPYDEYQNKDFRLDKTNGGVNMSRLITCSLIVVSLISYLYAYPARPQQDEAFQNSAGPKDKQSELAGGMAPKMSKVVDKLLSNAETLQLTEKQKESLSMIPDKYIYPLRRKEADYDIARMKVNNLMQDPNFDIAQVKEETKILEETALEMANISIDAIGEIRSTIGIENFKTILSMLGQKEKN